MGGFPLARLLDRVEPMGNAKYVAFQTLLDPARMPGQRGAVLHWPYVEGLRMDEAMHPLTILAGGLYGRELPPQNGAPLRLVVPWKYGFKGIKSIVKITLVSDQPPTTWNVAAPAEYGFYSNVNPPSPTRAGARRPSSGSANRPAADADVQRLRRPGRPPVRRHGPAGQLLNCVPISIRFQSEPLEPGGSIMKIDRFTKSVVLPQLPRAGYPPRLGRLGRSSGCQSCQLRDPHNGNPVAPLPPAVAGRNSREPDHRLGVARTVPANAGT